MKRLGVIRLGLIALTAVALALGLASAASKECERAARINKHVADSKTMTDEVKQELLVEAAMLCPDKADASIPLKKAEELVSQGKYADALKSFELAAEIAGEKACARIFEIARTLQKEGKEREAKAYFETALSICDDESAYKEYLALVEKAPAPDLEAKGEGALIRKDVIVESLLRRPDRDPSEEDRGIGIRRRPYVRYDDRYDRPDQRYRPMRGYCHDDENAPKVVFHNILFKSSSAELTESSRRQLDELGDALASQFLRRVGRFFIDGHCDSIGPEETNCDLAYRRAVSVIRYLEGKWDISPRRLIARSYGEYCPIASNTAEEGRRLNRRVEVKNADMVENGSGYWRGRCP